MKIFVVEIIPPQTELGETGFTGYCEELGIVTQGQDVPEILKHVLDLIPDMLEIQWEDRFKNYNQARKPKLEIPKYDIHISMPKNA